MSYWQRGGVLSSFGALASLLPGTPEEGAGVSPSPGFSTARLGCPVMGQQQPSFGEATKSQFGPSRHLPQCRDRDSVAIWGDCVAKVVLHDNQKFCRALGATFV
jgi:hypothetical protein